MALIFDIETDGIKDVSKLHCLVIKDTETGEIFKGTGSAIEVGVRALKKGDLIVGHNVINYDIPIIQQFFPWFEVDQKKVIDTLVLSRLIFSDMRERDGVNVERGLLPTKLWASHGLKAWGYRLGILKGEYKDEYGDDAFKEFRPEMLDYCVQDVAVTEALYQHLSSTDYSQQAIDLEHEVAWICSRMTRSGWPFDVKAASELYAKLSVERERIRLQMQETFEPLVIKRISEKTGKPLKDKVVEFNPASRDQIAERLINKYGWKPKEFTPAGKPKVDEDVLKALPYPEAQTLADYFLLEKRIGQLAEGDQAWLKQERAGKLHGSINTNGTVSGRCSHQQPNLGQVPSVRALYGKECRSLFTVPAGWRMVGSDLSGLELRALAGFMHMWDDGDYAKEILKGDIHTKNQHAAGLPTRDAAKNFIYCLIYGGGDERVGSIVGKGRDEGRRLKDVFMKNVPAYGRLRNAVYKAAEKGYLKGLDGRKLGVRSQHSSVNLLLQSCGAVISKRWLIECIHEADRRGLKYGWDGDYTLLGYIHDELQWAVREELAEGFGKFVVECAAKAGQHFNFKCPIDAEYKIGKNWCETH